MRMTAPVFYVLIELHAIDSRERHDARRRKKAHHDIAVIGLGFLKRSDEVADNQRSSQSVSAPITRRRVSEALGNG